MIKFYFKKPGLRFYIDEIFSWKHYGYDEIIVFSGKSGKEKVIYRENISSKNSTAWINVYRLDKTIEYPL